MPKSKSIIVTVDDAALPDIDSLAKRLTAKGMVVERVLAITGVITGTCAATKMSALVGLKGVASVEEDAGVQLAPPDSDVQ